MNSGFMGYRGLLCLFLLTVAASGQAEKPAAPPAPPKLASPTHAPAVKSPEAGSVPSDAAVITIPGLCEKPPVDKSKTAACKTVVTRAEFEQLIEMIAPNLAPAARKQVATQYGAALAMSLKAHEMGLDQGPKYQALMRVARIGVLTKQLSQKVQDDAGHVSDNDVENYYHSNPAAFEEADLQRIFIPRSKQIVEDKEKPDSDEAKKKQESEDVMKKVAESLRARAAAGEDFDKLQEEAATATTTPATSA